MDVGMVFMWIWNTGKVRKYQKTAMPSHLPDRGGQQVDDPLVGHRHHALPVDLYDPVADPHPAPLCNAPSQ